MEQKLYIARHAHAGVAETDEARPLTERGWKQIHRLVSTFKGTTHIAPKVIWHSHLLRATETATGLREGLALSGCREIEKSGLAPYDDPELIAEEIHGLEESTLIVGHNPHLSSLVTLLLQSECDRVVFPKASILCLSRMKVGTQSTQWQIEWHVHQKL
ncbi:MAG: hypothetical protein F6K21_28040, partial [Symploca sp. SIO2D2]|nr:hypothetical protein [Symploca sp. SIO2D2]